MADDPLARTQQRMERLKIKGRETPVWFQSLVSALRQAIKESPPGHQEAIEKVERLIAKIEQRLEQCDRNLQAPLHRLERLDEIQSN
jgi:hypothetical protein